MADELAALPGEGHDPHHTRTVPRHPTHIGWANNSAGALAGRRI